jgi:hypothetical protein
MMQISVSVVGALPIAARFKRAPEIMKELFEANFTTLGGTIAWVMREQMAEKKYTGDMERSVQWEVQSSPPQLKVGPEASHSVFVKEGTAPHWAPIEPLIAWAHWKLGDAKAAYMVQKKIAAFGTEGHDFIEMTLQDGRFQAALTNTARRLGTDLVAKVSG